MKKIFKITALIFLTLGTPASMCTKVITYAADHPTEAVVHAYSSNIAVAMQQAQKALATLGYEVAQVDESRNQIITGWQPSKSDSHYMELFKHKDYSGNSGAYYKLVVDVFEEAPRVKVSVYTIVKSLSGNLTSSHVVENQLLKRIDDYMRSPQIEMTNIGVQER